MDAHNYYSGKVCVVTGAGSGMGKATAALLVAEDAEVYALDIQPVAIEGIAKYIQVDLSEKNSIDHAFAELPAHIDCFFGVAGILGAANKNTAIKLCENRGDQLNTMPSEGAGRLGNICCLCNNGSSIEGCKNYGKLVSTTAGRVGGIVSLLLCGGRT